MNDTEYARLDHMIKNAFTAQAVNETFQSLGNALQDFGSDVRLTMTISGHNRYLTLSKYQESFKVCIYKSGDIDFHFKDPVYGDVRLRMVSYPDVNDLTATLQKFRNQLDWALNIFLYKQ